MDSPSRTLQVVLVHGTWGRGLFRFRPIAQWCQEGSLFRYGLLRSFEGATPGVYPSISVFGWSGANSIIERAKAADELAVHLRTKLTENAPILIIAHSHGGNVALKAVGQLAGNRNIYVCTLATPFFRLFESSREYKMSESVFIILLSAGFSYLSNQAYSGLLAEPSKVTAAVWLLLTILLGLLISFRLASLLNKVLVNPPPKAGDHPTAWQLRPQILCEAAAFDAKALDDRLLILRGADDEAAMSLAVGAVTNRLLRFLYDVSVTPALHVGYLVVLLCTFAFTLSASPVLVHIQYAIFGTTAFALILPSVIRGVFGRDLVFGALRCDATYESAPDTDSARIETLLFGAGDKRMIHKLYDNPATPDTIVKWMNRHANSPIRDSAT